ncbi:MAG: response regulator [Candidatus Marinimicrobia bacterium]|nr:response regulator [Candidatus Neomarinimicrobiota bacterium]MCF7839750.1 response regulator [Candidatus Neomarinimicrobiota bacterium]MCF7903394.1 response regulator [Candidatus Neomarinimicrobiota bacterium]
MGTSKGKILVVEDMHIQRENLRQILQLEGYTVESGENGLEALEVLKGGYTPELVICDIMMPEMDGYQLREAMRENPEWRGMGFIFLSAKASKEDIQAGKSYGVEEYLTKPVEISALIQAVEVSLNRLQEIREFEKSRNEELFRELFTRVSHEMRTPLSIITSGLSLFELESATSPEIKQYLNYIVNGHDRILALVEKVRHMQEAREAPAEDALIPTIAARDIQKLFKNIFEKRTFFGRFTEKDVDFDLHLTDEDRELKVNVTELEMILEEVLENAIKFSDSSRHVVVSGQLQDEDKYELVVEDSGKGFPLEAAEAIFKPFYQYQREVQEQQGMGVGLAVVKSLAQKNRIALTVDNGPDKHGRFYLTIPVAT